MKGEGVLLRRRSISEERCTAPLYSKTHLYLVGKHVANVVALATYPHHNIDPDHQYSPCDIKAYDKVFHSIADRRNHPFIANGTIIKQATPLRRAFFDDIYEELVFTSYLAKSWTNSGGLLVLLPLIVVGISLYSSYWEWKKAGAQGARMILSTFTTVFALVVCLWSG